jgi:lipid II:glycine glycyltransferase (peptidoglycan interpeptide bridge formation enzyme)
LLQFNGDAQEARQFLTFALARLAEHLRHRNICAILLRFNPMLPLPLEPFQTRGKLVMHGETVWSDLRHTPEQLWSETRSRFRSYIRGLERDGYTVELDPAGKELDTFIDLYYDSMRRVGAGPEYFFSRSYFQSLQKLLGKEFLLAHVRSPSGAIVSSGIFTHSAGIVQYHLSGNNISEEGSNALKLLLHSMRLWSQQQGYVQFHLGGGVGAQNDPLFQFKSGFSPARARFYTWRYIVDEEKYAGLNLRWERINRALADSIDGYFPAYRKILPPPQTGTLRACA